MKVLASDKIADKGIQMLKAAGFEVEMKTGLPEDDLVKIIPQYDALIVRSGTKVTPKIIEAGKNLKIIARAGVGVDNVDLPAATKKGIIVVNSPEGNTIAAAEHSIAMLLAMMRNIPQAQASLAGGKWDRKSFEGSELYNKVLGVIGLGKIGRRVVNYALSFGMKVIAYDPFVTEEAAKKLGVDLRKNLDEVLKEADILTFHLPKNKETLGMINAEKFKIMKKGVRIVNCARGGIIVEKDLAEAVKSGQVGGAAIDVWEKEPTTESPLFKLPNVVFVPHLGASTKEAQLNVTFDVVEQVIDVLKGGNARSAVNIPSMKPEVLAAAEPYMGIAEKLGRLASQLVEGAVSKVKINYIGEVSELDVSPLSLAALKGLLESSQESVTLVNAPLIAKELGLKVIESKIAESEDYANLILIEVTAGKEKRAVGGARLGSFGERLVMIDKFRVDAYPEGYLLILSNIDKPGMIGKVGTLLGKYNINIAGMDVGRVKINEQAVMVINVDSEVPDKVLAELEKLEGISSAKLVKL